MYSPGRIRMRVIESLARLTPQDINAAAETANMFFELEKTAMCMLEVLTWASACGNCLLVFRVLQKSRIPSAPYIMLLAVLDCILLVQLFIFLQDQHPVQHDLYSFIVVSSLQSSMCKMAALLSEKILIESCVGRHVNGPGYENLPAKYMPQFVALCLLAPVGFLLVLSLNLECLKEWRLLFKILQILALHTLPLAAIVYLTVGMRRFLTKMTEMKSDCFIVLDNDSKRDKQFTTFIISTAMTSFLTYPIYAMFLVVDFVHPNLSQVWVVIAAALTMNVQCGINVCLLLAHKAL